MAWTATVVHHSAIDSERFGISIARADGMTVAVLKDIMAECGRTGVRMLIARCPASDIAAVQAMEASGFRLMDAQVRYARRLGGSLPSRDDSRLHELRPDDVEAVVTITRESFTGYAGHYHADAMLARDRCDEVYPSWARRCCTGEAAEHVVVAELAGKPAGFSAFARAGDSEGRLVLGAVAGWARGQQLYTAMALAGLAWGGEMGLRLLSGITQTTNIAAQQSWIRAGMFPVDVWYTLHRWFD